ncbi:DUF881 domain-containing protein [Clostridium butanoliproducens]|uniref:DUF881 domain-containing protein n=1 Tax=Clostridium butanoliproducens TaxID=2991837 RepID=UPI0024B994DC|nr:DUF881 domain-containing protein [Clostridium butanoliproducens]
MRTNEATIFLFIASIIVGLLISMNIDLGKSNAFLDIKQYELAYNERGDLQRQISDLQGELNELNKKIKKYEHNSQNSYGVLGEINNELNKNKMILGTVPLQGEGIRITLNDSPQVNFGGKYEKSMLIHDADIVKVINELRNAGAEAIAVNDYRVTYNAFGICFGSNINVNGIKVVAPFYITAIGNKDIMGNYLETQENHVKKLKRRTCYVEIETLDNIEIQPYNGTIKSNYLNEVPTK